PHPPVAAKGKTAPLVAWRLLREEAASAPSRRRAPLVGRDAEVAQLVGALDDALAGKGRTISIVGEAGLGKTRLVDEVLADPRALGARVARAACSPYDSHRAYGAIADLLRRALAIAPALANTAALVITTYRPELTPPWTTARGHLQLRLGPLDESSCATLLASLLPAGALPKEAIADVVARSSGNPTYIEEAARWI